MGEKPRKGGRLLLKMGMVFTPASAEYLAYLTKKGSVPTIDSKVQGDRGWQFRGKNDDDDWGAGGTGDGLIGEGIVAVDKALKFAAEHPGYSLSIVIAAVLVLGWIAKNAGSLSGGHSGQPARA